MTAFLDHLLAWQPVLAALAATGMMLVGTPVLIRVAVMRQLFDSPDGKRKVHHRLVPSLGGVMIFICIQVGFSFSGAAETLAWSPYLTGSLVALFFLGLKDDFVGLSPGKKLFFEGVFALAVMLASNGVIGDFGGVLGITEVPAWLGVGATWFTMLVVMNAYNLIDGLDGLAGGLGALAAGAFGAGFWLAGQTGLAVLGLLTAAVMLGYLYHNRHPASIFMGDSGSLTVGFLLAVLAIHFVPLSADPAFDRVLGESSPGLAVAILSYPLYDTLRSYVRRVASGRSPFLADRGHIHHLLLDMGLGQRRVVSYLCAVWAVPVLACLAAREAGPNWMMAATLSATVLVYPTFGVKRWVIGKLGVQAGKSIPRWLH